MGCHVTQRNENGLGRKAERGNGKELGGGGDPPRGRVPRDGGGMVGGASAGKQQ